MINYNPKLWFKHIFHFPKSVENSFKSQYDRIVWEKNEVDWIGVEERRGDW